MKTVTTFEAKTNLSRIISEALAGEDIVIARGKQPVVRIVPIKGAKIARRIGGCKGVVKSISSDFFQPLDDFKEYMP